MAMMPKIIIFDEPTAGLDPAGRDIVLSKIKEYRDLTGALVFIVSHSMEDMAKTADKLLVMSKGEVVMYDKTEEIFSHSKKLEEIGLNVPQITRVFNRLREKGYNVPDNIFTVEKGIEALSNNLLEVLK